MLNFGFQDRSFVRILCADCHAVDWPQHDRTPNPIGPEWYFLFLYAGLKTSKLPTGAVALVILATYLVRVDSITSYQSLTTLTGLCALGVLALSGHEAIEEFQLLALSMLGSAVRRSKGLHSNK